jgi:hypothetical protein
MHLFCERQERLNPYDLLSGPIPSKSISESNELRQQTKRANQSIGPFSLLLGRDGGIRTRDPLHPMQVRYQAALRPEAF